jgi:hypothetical protein
VDGIALLEVSARDGLAHGARHALHCAAAWGDARGIHGLATAGLFEADVAEPVCARDGGVAVPAAPGLGVAR